MRAGNCRRVVPRTPFPVAPRGGIADGGGRGGGERVPHRGGGAAPAAMDSRVSELFGGCCRPTGAAFRGRGGAAPGCGGGGGGSKAKKKSGRSRGGKANNPPYLPPEVSRLPAAAEGTPRGLSGPAKGPGGMGGEGGQLCARRGRSGDADEDGAAPAGASSAAGLPNAARHVLVTARPAP